ncbi:MAG: MMPL family transporter [Thermomicrobiales bacterium]|nr:MMPL family transporter [Thermomicrobiales bacterium]
MALLSTSGISRRSAEKPWWVILGWIIAMVVAGASTATWLGDALTTDFESYADQDSVTGLHLLEERMQYPDPERETVVITSDSVTADDPAFRAVVDGVVADLRGQTEFIDPDSVISYYEFAESDDPAVASQAEGLVAEDGSAVIVPVTLVGSLDEVSDHSDDYLDVLDQHATDEIDVISVGSMSLNVAFNEISEQDLQRGEGIGIPIAFIILIVVFGAIVAAFVPIVLALVAIFVAIGLAAFIGNFRDLSFLVTNMITLIGLAVGIDYSLFVVERYREERRHGRSKLDAIEEAGGTASKAVLFSGLTVVIALLGLFIMPNSIFQSLGTGAILVVIVAVLAVMTLIPAIISLLGNKLDWPRRFKYDDAAVAAAYKKDAELIHKGFWGRVSRVVMTHPWPCVLLAGGLLVALSIPYFNMNKGFEGFATMPESDVKTAFMVLDEKFAAGRLSPFDIVVDAENTDDVNAAIETLKSSLTSEAGFASAGDTMWSPENDLAHFQVFSEADPNAEAAYDALAVLRSDLVPAAFDGVDARVYVTGDTAFNQDFFDLTDQRTPWVFAFVLGFSFILLMIAFRSIVIPLKAIVMNLLSVGAAYGLLVLVFQEGHGAGFFGFTQTPTIEAWLPLMLFCVLFGLSMDYQVFLISRIREQFDLTGNNTHAVATGLQLTAKLITGAAAIMVVVFSGFAAGQLSSLQQMGFGLAVAIAIDATIVRSILVPAAMRLLGNWNWYLPSWLNWLPDLRIEGTPRPEHDETGHVLAPGD